MVNSGITNVGIFAKEKYRSLTDHIGSGSHYLLILHEIKQSVLLFPIPYIHLLLMISVYQNMGVYIFDWKMLKGYFEEVDNNGANYDDFGKNLIPKMLEDQIPMFVSQIFLH